MILPTLYHKGKNGQLRQWTVSAIRDEVHTEYGVVDGKLIKSSFKVEAKNVGRSNETTPEEQAKLEAKALWKHKVDRKYSETPNGAEEQLELPMLAHTYSGTKRKKFEFPAHIQPKLDGVRCLAQKINGEIHLTSRQGKPWNIPHIEDQLYWLEEGTILDGEIYSHGKSCQQITSLVRCANPKGKNYKPGSTDLSFYIYDVPSFKGDDSLEWRKRKIHLDKLYGNQDRPNLVWVESSMIWSEDEAYSKHKQYLLMGYEGSVLRGLTGKYLWGYRSSELLKLKDFQDAEFEVVEIVDGKGKMEGCAVFICRNDTADNVFECTIKTSMKERRKMYKEKHKYLGKKLTVQFFDRTDAGIPRFPVGIAFRDEADLPSS